MVHQAPFLNRHYILITFLCFSCAPAIQEEQLRPYNAASLQLQMENGLAMQQGALFTGLVYALQPNEEDTLEIMGFKEGKEHGEWKRFYPDGRLEWMRYYTHGKKTGNFITWWPNGVKQMDYHFEEGEYEGQCLEWNEFGRLINERNYTKGYEEGQQKQFYDNGKVKSNYVMIDGKRYGLLGTKNCVNVADSVFKK
jgi:antitoxin component YwqK of YwqJK toxin-antitoxin module